MEQKPLKEVILEQLEIKGFNLEKVLLATEIPKHSLEAILKGEWQKLPAAPYARGYFKKLEEILELQPDVLWNHYREETEIKTSGSEDRLPENRFAINAKSRKWIWPILIIVVALIYFGFNFSRLLGRPEINISNPLSASAIATVPTFTFTGEINPKDKLFINQEEIYVDKSGKFQEDYKLQPGLNTFEFVAKRFLGKETQVIKQIIYQPNEGQGEKNGR